MTAPTTTARNATLADIEAILNDQQTRKVDVIAPATAIRAKGGVIHIEGTEPTLTDDGVTMTAGQYRPTAIFDEGVSNKLGVPLTYVRTLRAQRPDLYDANVNGWLHGRSIRRAEGVDVIHPADFRSFLVRAFRTDGDTVGVARALLSNAYGIVDNLDYVVALLDGIRESGVNNPVINCDLTDRRMVVRVTAPELWALAPTLLAGYRSPFTGKTGVDSKRIFAGLVASNSEVGGGAWNLTPRLEVEACSNGMTMVKDATRGVHLTSRQDDGLVQWSDDTKAKELALVTAKTRDAVTTYLNVDYMTAKIAEMERSASKEITDPEAAIELVVSKMKYSKEHTRGIFEHFIKGGQVTAGGVMQAITAYSQTLDDADAAFDLDNTAVRAMEVAASAR